MLKEGNKLYSIFFFKCPKCHKGDLFTNPNMLNLRDLHKMPEKCPVCEQDFVIETGFFYGAMYVSYGLTVAFLFTVMGLDILLTGYLERTRLLVYIAIVLLLWTYIFRLSRAIWINVFVPYDKDAA